MKDLASEPISSIEPKAVYVLIPKESLQPLMLGAITIFLHMLRVLKHPKFMTTQKSPHTRELPVTASLDLPGIYPCRFDPKCQNDVRIIETRSPETIFNLHPSFKVRHHRLSISNAVTFISSSGISISANECFQNTLAHLKSRKSVLANIKMSAFICQNRKIALSRS